VIVACIYSSPIVHQYLAPVAFSKKGNFLLEIPDEKFEISKKGNFFAGNLQRNSPALARDARRIPLFA
jgi:hypothetical protein